MNFPSIYVYSMKAMKRRANILVRPSIKNRCTSYKTAMLRKLLLTHPSLFFSRRPQVRFDSVHIDFGHRRFYVVHIEASCNGNFVVSYVSARHVAYNSDVGSEGYNERNVTPLRLIHEFIKNYTASHAERQ